MPSRYAVTQSHLVRGLGELVVLSWTPPILKGLRFNAPRRLNADAIWNNGAPGVQSPSVQSVDAVGSFDHARTRLITPAQASVLRIEKDGGVTEGERENLVYPSSDFSDARWAKTNVAVDSDAQLLPNGATGTVNELRGTAANGTIIQDLAIIASAVKPFSIWLKRKTGNGDIQITLDGGTTWTTVPVITTWTRFDKTQTLADPDVGIRIVTSGDEVIAWNGQLEDSVAFRSRDILTAGAAATRAADVLDHPASGNIAAGFPYTILFAITPDFDSTEPGFMGLFDSRNSAANWGVRVGYSAAGVIQVQVRNATSYQANLSGAVSFSKGDTLVLATTGQVNDFNVYNNGALIAGPDTSGSVPANHNQIRLGNLISGNNPFFGRIAHLLIYDRVLSTIEIMILTSTIQSWMGLR